MMYTTDHKQVLKWLSEGKKVQIRMAEWTTLNQEGALRRILSGYTGEWKLGNPTIVIDGITLEAPVQPKDAIKGEQYWYMNNQGDIVYMNYDMGYVHRNLIYTMRTFYSKKAAQDMQDFLAEKLKVQE